MTCDARLRRRPTRHPVGVVMFAALFVGTTTAASALDATDFAWSHCVEPLSQGGDFQTEGLAGDERPISDRAQETLPNSVVTHWHSEENSEWRVVWGKTGNSGVTNEALRFCFVDLPGDYQTVPEVNEAATMIDAVNMHDRLAAGNDDWSPVCKSQGDQVISSVHPNARKRHSLMIVQGANLSAFERFTPWDACDSIGGRT